MNTVPTSTLGTKDSSSRKNRLWVTFVPPSEISRKECRASLAFAFSSDHGEVTRRSLFLTSLPIFCYCCYYYYIKISPLSSLARDEYC